MVWRSFGGDVLRWSPEGEEASVHWSPSGATHLLNDVAAEALRLLEERPRTVAELTAALTGPAGSGADLEFEEQIARLLTRFEELGLAEPVS